MENWDLVGAVLPQGHYRKTFWGIFDGGAENGLTMRFFGILENRKVGKKREDFFEKPWYNGIVEMRQ